MMFLQRGETLLGTFPARLRHGKADIHVSDMRVLIEEYKLGCIMTLSLGDMDSCKLSPDPSNKKKTVLTISHIDCRYAEIHTKDGEKLAEMIRSAHANYKSTLIKIGAITEDSTN